jgi:glycosyltransferase involved in cell wall biosynthesis
MANKDPEALQKAVTTRDEELAIMRQADVTLSYNDVEHAVIQSHNLDSTNVVKAPWVVDIPSSVPPFAERKGVAFLGGFGHYPNVEAVEYFVSAIMPALRSELPGTEFHVFGSKLPDHLKKLEADDISCPGYVPDVRTVYDHHRVFVAPLLTGAGIKGKVLAAMAHGIPCVLSRVAAEGTGARDGHDCLIADTPEEWAQCIKKLHQDEALWTRISEASRTFVGTEYSFERGMKVMRNALEAAGIYVEGNDQDHRNWAEL